MEMMKIQQTMPKVYEMLEHMGRAPSMYVGATSYRQIASFLGGYDTATGLLKGFREWLVPKAGMDYGCYHFNMLALIIAIPSCNSPRMPIPDEPLAIRTLCNLAIEFLHYKEEVGAEKIVADYEKIHSEWYNSL